MKSRSGILLVKYWFSVTREAQLNRFNVAGAQSYSPL